jgi:hypothetical protein
VGFGGRLFLRAQELGVQQPPGALVALTAPAAAPFVPEAVETFPADEPADLASNPQLPGLADLRAALNLVAGGAATSVTLGGFPDGHELLRVGRELAIEGNVVEPLICFGGGIDIRVRRAAPTEA